VIQDQPIDRRRRRTRNIAAGADSAKSALQLLNVTWSAGSAVAPRDDAVARESGPGLNPRERGVASESRLRTPPEPGLAGRKTRRATAAIGSRTNRRGRDRDRSALADVAPWPQRFDHQGPRRSTSFPSAATTATVSDPFDESAHHTPAAASVGFSSGTPTDSRFHTVTRRAGYGVPPAGAASRWPLQSTARRPLIGIPVVTVLLGRGAPHDTAWRFR